jgi:hypothetical protein
MDLRADFRLVARRLRSLSDARWIKPRILVLPQSFVAFCNSFFPKFS